MIVCFNKDATSRCIIPLVHFLIVLFRLGYKTGHSVFSATLRHPCLHFLNSVSPAGHHLLKKKIDKKQEPCKSFILPSAPSAVGEASVPSPELHSVTTHCAH